MIRQLDLTNRTIVKQILNIQIPAYKVEASIINFDGIPQLQDTVDTIIESGEMYFGYWMEDKLVGFISFTIDQNQCDICRLVVDPKHFRKGIAQSLMDFLLEHVSQESTITVSTGEKNVPARRLYKLYGFCKVRDIEVAPNVFITQLSKQLK